MKKILLRIATVICMAVSVMGVGQVSAFADEVKPIHEFTFDKDIDRRVYDSGEGINKYCDGLVVDTKDMFVNGYNDIGRARHFDGVKDTRICFNDHLLPIGAKSIRFKIKKNASTNTDKSEAILSSLNGTGYGLYIGIGKLENNLIPGSLYVKDTSSGIEMQTPNSICDGEWHDVLFTWNGTLGENAAKLYVDDMITPVIQTTATAKEVDKYHFPKLTMTLHIGYSQHNFTDTVYHSLSTYFIGDLDNIQIYNSAITVDSTTPGDPTDPGDTTIGNKALLVITMVTGEQKEYEMTADEINDFITWYNSKAASSPTYMIDKDYNHASFISRKDYIAYEQISNFEINEYNE